MLRLGITSVCAAKGRGVIAARLCRPCVSSQAGPFLGPVWVSSKGCILTIRVVAPSGVFAGLMIVEGSAKIFRELAIGFGRLFRRIGRRGGLVVRGSALLKAARFMPCLGIRLHIRLPATHKSNPCAHRDALPSTAWPPLPAACERGAEGRC